MDIVFVAGILITVATAIPVVLQLRSHPRGLFVLFFRTIIRRQEASMTRAARGFAAAYPVLAERCGGAEGLKNPQFVTSVLQAVDDSKRPGLFGRLFGAG